MEIKEIFENLLKIENKVMSLESLFNNDDRLAKTNFKPPYQRNYVWDDEKATYFVESILLGTEIPPLIYFRNRHGAEVVDGRQRYETILRFIESNFKLKKNGLQKLDNIEIANKTFKDLSNKLQDLFWDTKLRIIEFSFHSPNLVSEEMEELVKREIFKRYNSGITPLKPTEIDNAVYIDHDLNSFFKKKLQSDRILFRDVSTVLHFEKTNNEIILKKIRQLLVQHKIPIKYYAVKKDNVVGKFYEFLFSNIGETEIEEIFTSFIQKINLLTEIRAKFPIKLPYNRLISECIFWAFSIVETEKGNLEMITHEVIDDLVMYIVTHLSSFEMDRSSFYRELFTRYEVTSEFFSNEFDIDFRIYLHNNSDFKKENKNLTPSAEEAVSFDDLRINKPEPTSTAIVDIARLMTRQRFLIRPPYQRNEVINKKKSSSIIESILLGIKLPPIFVYKRADDISEVLDGQQRLLSILGFTGKQYLDENNKMRSSNKDGFSLSLKNNILHTLHGKTFDHLSPEDREKILNFDLYVIEISHKNNPNFEPIDLFIRLNNKPYPIKEDTFELWNSYISRDIITTIKQIQINHSGWFYIRKINSRMENENIYTTLAYFQLSLRKTTNGVFDYPNELDIYKVVNKINFRVRSKNEITKTLENNDEKLSFITAANDLEFSFIRKVKALLTDHDDSINTLNKNLDDVFRAEKGRRTQQNFYALWYFLFDIPLTQIEANKLEIRKSLKSLFADIAKIESKDLFDEHVSDFKKTYKTPIIDFDYHSDNSEIRFAFLGEIAQISSGTAKLTSAHPSSLFEEPYPVLAKGALLRYSLNAKDLLLMYVNSQEDKKAVFNSREKILLARRMPILDYRFELAFYDSRLAFGQDVLGIVVNRFSFLPKFVFAFLASKICYKSIEFKSAHEETALIGVLTLRALKIPILPVENQRVFVFIADQILQNSGSESVILFFERLIDAMFYEVYFELGFMTARIKILEYIQQLSLKVNDLSERNSIYSVLSSPLHPISANLLKILSLKEVQDFENRKQ